MNQPPKTQQEILQEQFQARTAQARQAALSTWKEATGLPQKLILIGGLVGVIAFFLPWASVSAIGVNLSGWIYAREGANALWGFPLMMLAAVFFVWFHLHSSAPNRILGARWHIVMGAAWSWYWITELISSHFGAGFGFGGYLATLASGLILIGGILQTRDSVRDLPNAG